ncbi:MAG: PH domain-containing protein [Candidatus Bathyarchaeaceae archaeon]
MDVVNRPRVSKFIAGLYVGLVVFIAALTIFFTYASFFTPMGILGLTAVVVLIFVEAIILLILISIYRTKYILTDKELVIKTSRLIGGGKRVNLRDMVHVEKTLIPFGIRLFGTSFHGGYYQIPGLGRAFTAIINFNDGILIKTKHGNYIITPQNPENFREAISHAVKSLQILASQD